VSEGHPDKVADQISDAILDEFLRKDPSSKVACETFVSTGLVVIGGEVKSEAWVDIQQVARDTIRRIGYTKGEYMFDANSCAVLSALHEQSADINRGVEREQSDDQGAGDQGMMFGYACNETPEYMPLPIFLAHLALRELANIRREGKLMPYLRPDAKSQFTIEYSNDHVAQRIDTIVISTQHDEFDDDFSMQQRIHSDVKNILIPRMVEKLDPKVASLFNTEFKLLVNPTGKFVIGGPHGDTGLTGRKIIVDTYGGRGAHGGGAFSGKDSSKVDRSAAYAARYIAKNLVAAGVAGEMLVQLSYAIGVAQPLSIYVNSRGSLNPLLTIADSDTGTLRPMNDGDVARKIGELFDLRPARIVKKFGLTNPIFGPTAAYGHVGRTPYKEMVTVYENGKATEKEVQFFGWELLDSVEMVKKAFGL